MPARHKGNVDIRQIHSEQVWDDVNGWTTVVKYQGKWADIQTAAVTAGYVGGASRINVTQNGDQSQDGILTVSFAAFSQAEALSSTPTINEFSNTWTLSAAEEEQTIEKHNNYRALAGITSEEGYLQRILIAVQEYKNKVANGISNATTDKDLTFSLASYITKKGTAAQQDLADELADLLLQGQDTYPRDRYALRNVRVVPGNSDITASHVATRQMWSNDNITALISSSASAITQRALIGDIVNTFDGSYWLKLAPTIDELNNGRYQIVTEFINYEADEFSTFIFSKYE